MSNKLSDETRINIVMFLIACQVARLRTEPILTTTMYKTKFKQWINLALEEIEKQDKLYAQIWLADEQNMVNIEKSLEQIVEIIGKQSPAGIVKVAKVLKDTVENPLFENLPVFMRPLNDDLFNVKYVGNELTIWVTNKPLFKAVVNIEEHEKAVRKELVKLMQERIGLEIVKYHDTEELAVTDGDSVWVLEDKKHNYTYLNGLKLNFKVTLKPSRRL